MVQGKLLSGGTAIYRCHLDQSDPILVKIVQKWHAVVRIAHVDKGDCPSSNTCTWCIDMAVLNSVCRAVVDSQLKMLSPLHP